MDAQDFSFVCPRVHELNVDGVPVVVSPMCVGEYEALAAALLPLRAELDSAPVALLDRALAGTSLTDDDKAQLIDWGLKVIATRLHDVIRAVAVCTRQSAQWVSSLLPDRLLVLLMLCLEVNADFFARMLPSLRDAAARLKPSTGQTPSSSSSPTATATTTSADTPSDSSAPTSNAATAATASAGAS